MVGMLNHHSPISMAVEEKKKPLLSFRVFSHTQFLLQISQGGRVFFLCSATSFFPGGEFNHSFQRPCSGFYRTCVRANRGRGFELGTTTNLWFHHEVPQVPYRARGSVCVRVYFFLTRTDVVCGRKTSLPGA